MRKNKEIKIIFGFIIILFLVFLIAPLGMIIWQSIKEGQAINITHYKEVIYSKDFLEVLKNSFFVSGLAAILTTVLAFIVAYTLHYTHISQRLKKSIKIITMLPMLLPTITYGFAIIYSFGKQGLWTIILNKQIIDIYSIQGLLLGYIIYTLPIAFMLIYNALGYIDKKYTVVSKLMKDRPFKTFLMTVIRPLAPTLVAAFIQAFFLSFTDFGIPASVGGQYQVLASKLYTEMLGSIPNFGNGAVIAVIMLIPSVLSIILLRNLDKYNIRYTKTSVIEVKENRVRDFVWGSFAVIIDLGIMLMFAVVFIVPFVNEWPYDLTFTLEYFKTVLTDPSLIQVVKNSLIVAILTSICGTIIVYGSALIVARSEIKVRYKKWIEGIGLITNTVPGMVLGIAYMLLFSGTSIQNTIFIIVICNIVHYYSSPFLMLKNSLMKMNARYETTAKLMGDSWFKTVVRVVTPNISTSLIEVFSYFFTNAMVTVSAIIFISGARTMVMTTKIKELQHFVKFKEIFVLSLLILLINLIVKGILEIMTKKRRNRYEKKRV